MPIEVTEPTVIEATYPYWAFAIETSGFPCAPPGGSTPDIVGCRVTLVKFRVREDSVPEQSPLPSDIKTIQIPDIYALAETVPEVATALNALMIAVEVVADAQGVR